jgi:hypothetical protein
MARSLSWSGELEQFDESSIGTINALFREICKYDLIAFYSTRKALLGIRREITQLLMKFCSMIG